jgi:hypothetical protein
MTKTITTFAKRYDEVVGMYNRAIDNDHRPASVAMKSAAQSLQLGLTRVNKDKFEAAHEALELAASKLESL